MAAGPLAGPASAVIIPGASLFRVAVGHAGQEHAVIRIIHRSGNAGRLLILAVAALAPVLAGCEAGNNAPTLQWHQPTDGTGTIHHGIAIRNMFVLGPPLGSTLVPGQSASLFFAIMNEGSAPDRLLSISAPGAARSVRLASGPVPLGVNQMVRLTGPAPRAVLTDLTRRVTGGSVIHLILTFQNAGTVAVSVPVMPRAQYFSTYFQPPTPSPTPTAHTRHHHASPGATGSPSPTPST
jgi:copper(I)-binding protein